MACLLNTMSMLRSCGLVRTARSLWAGTQHRFPQTSLLQMGAGRLFSTEEDSETDYVPSAAAQVFETMDDEDKWLGSIRVLMIRFALMNRISMPLSESDLSRMATSIRNDFQVNNVMTVCICVLESFSSCANVCFSMLTSGFQWKATWVWIR